MFTIDKVTEGLYIGNELTAGRRDLLQRHAVTHILTAGFGLKRHFPECFQYKQLDLLDLPNYQIQRHFPDCIAFIDSAIADGGTVFVHCFQGVSRSATLVIAYLMYKQQTTLTLALRFLKEKHPDTDPNFGFVYQLGIYEGQLKNGTFVPLPLVAKVEKGYCACILF